MGNYWLDRYEQDEKLSWVVQQHEKLSWVVEQHRCDGTVATRAQLQQELLNHLRELTALDGGTALRRLLREGVLLPPEFIASFPQDVLTGEQ